MFSIVYLLLLLIAAIFFGKVAERYKQPTIVGNIFGGLIFGPVLISVLKSINIHLDLSQIESMISNLNPASVEDELSFLIEFAIIMLMFASGLETRIRDFVASFRTGILTAALGVIVPFTLGFGGGYLATGDWMVGLYIGAALSITAVALSIATLIQMDAIHTRFGMTIINAAIVDDIIGIIILSVLLSISKTGDLPSPLTVGGTVVLAVIFVVISLWLLPRILKTFYSETREMRLTERVGITILFAGLIALVAHIMGLHLMIGAFLGGMAIRGSLNHRTQQALGRWAFGFFAPLFFAWVGFSVTFSPRAFSLFLPMLIVLGFFGKVIGAGLGAKLSGLTWSESVLVGIGMNGKAAVELILAAIALKAGIIGPDIYSAVVLMAAFMALVTPIMLKSAGKLFMRKGWIEEGG
ncbi:MAG: cation:proton antiporter [Thermoplasmatota archaeon]